MAPSHHLRDHRDDLIVVLLALAAMITFLADALGWFRNGLFFGR